jgi:hypothetical protein
MMSFRNYLDLVMRNNIENQIEEMVKTIRKTSRTFHSPRFKPWAIRIPWVSEIRQTKLTVLTV